LSYLDLQEIMAERGIRVDASTIYRWVQAYAPEQDHRRIKRLVRLGLSFKRFDTARRTLQDNETVSMIRKGRVEHGKSRDGKALATSVEPLFRGVA
jgi:transposase-like protein